jgi:hypothetical protein
MDELFGIPGTARRQQREFAKIVAARAQQAAVHDTPARTSPVDIEQKASAEEVRIEETI